MEIKVVNSPPVVCCPKCGATAGMVVKLFELVGDGSGYRAVGATLPEGWHALGDTQLCPYCISTLLGSDVAAAAAARSE